jgi:ABC-2 type transport system permease protein
MSVIVRAAAFLTKEIAEIVRQPRLIGMLIIGPFLILLLFGVGYRTATPPVRTLFVVPQGSLIGADIQKYAKELEPAMTYEGSTQSLEQAALELRDRKVDLVVVVPNDPEKDVLSNKQAPFTFLYNQVNPLEVNQINYVAQVFASTVNREILKQAVSTVQSAAGNAQSAAGQVGAPQTIQQEIEQALRVNRSVSPGVVVEPFIANTKPLVAAPPTAKDFFAPAVIILLLQHLAVTLGALSIVRERTLGTMDLFRVSPLSAGETLAGKYISLFVFGGFIAALLSILMVFGLGVPMAGSWWSMGEAIATVLFASLGWGFLISTISKNESQAVQYSMIVLLASFFFSGFVLSLNTLIQPVQIISRLLPATYGIAFLQDVMFRAEGLGTSFLASVLGLGVGLLILARLLLGHRLRHP